jgi:hypothetical protein
MHIPYKESYSTINELLDRIGFIKTMRDYIKSSNPRSPELRQWEAELLDREIELIEFVAQIDQEEDKTTLIFRTENFDLVTPNIARELYDLYY